MADAPAGDIRATILSELAAGDGAAAAPVVEEAPAEAEVAADESTDDVETVADEAGPEDDAPADADADDEEDNEDLVSADPETQKRLDAVRRAEKRMRGAAERRDLDFQAERAKWQTQVDRVAEIDRLSARMKYDPIPALRALGVTDEDLVSIAQAAYAESPEGQKDPARKAQAQARLKEREREEKMSASEKRLADLEAKLESQKAEAASAAEAQRYITEINTAAATKYPLTAHMLKIDASETTDSLVAIYNRLGQAKGKAPKAAEVVAEFDRRERARLTKLGIDPAVIVKSKPLTAAKPKAAANTNAPAAKTAAPANGAPKKAPTKEEILAELAALPS